MDTNKPQTLKEYIREKIKILKQLGHELTDEQLDHIWSLKTEIQVDNFASSVILPHRHNYKY